MTKPFSWLIPGLLLSPFYQIALSFELQPIASSLIETGRHATRDDDFSVLDLLSSETFLWGGSQNGRSALGNLTVHMPGDAENIISMEKFQPLLRSTECTNKSMTMDFKDERSYQYGQRLWQWVNDADERRFVLVAGNGHCGWNQHRLPFVVSNVLFNDAKNMISVIGYVSDWKTVAHTYELFVGGHPSSEKRDIDKTFSLDFNHALPLSSKSFSMGDFKFTYDCDDCGTKGEFEFQFELKTELFIPTGVSMTLSPQGVSANFNPRLGLSANFTGTKTDEMELGKIPIDGLTIPGGILDLGPEIVFSWGYALGPIIGTAGVSTGVSIGLEDSAELKIDLTSPDLSASGWTPKVTKKPITVDASISGGIKVNTKAAMELALEALNTGFEIGLDLEPWAGATLTVASSSGAVCPDDPENHHFGVKVAPSAGVNLNVEASQAGDENEPFLSKAIASLTMPLPSMCTGFGAPSNAAGSSRKTTTKVTSTPLPRPYTTYSPTTAPPTVEPTTITTATSTYSYSSSSAISSIPASSPYPYIHRKRHIERSNG
ncbi:uncharacterized protein N7496_007660 [Penicillium cataractarum]|uniref:Peptidase A1 domain-containing protein n=1 Tax=Penicillium cataractarum TaxID=2100454 RepID=A0A9W9V672_9EURO|nr:uncharacterized protein N7496_007660 [Penicillium cataractarum]KAJ5367900.1 hypothetical protein N7496_007660 [Penicillium cataractarum]